MAGAAAGHTERLESTGAPRTPTKTPNSPEQPMPDRL
jgi:hypothetical protein